MSLALQLAQQASAERSVIAPWMYAVVLIGILLLLGYLKDFPVQSRST